jgi:HlyD family secretion protein
VRNVTLFLVAIAGVGLAGVTMLQARRMEGEPHAARPVETPASRSVAAEGRVVAYPGSEVVVGTERGGRVVRLSLEEGQTVRRADLVAERIVAAHDLDQATRDLDTARARRETARAAVARDEAQIRKTRIVAPISGTVIGRHAQAGETLEASQRVVTLADLTRLRIEAEADEADADALGTGAPVSITCEAFPGRAWRGRLEEIPRSVTLRRLKPQDPGRPTDTRILAVKVAFAEPTPLKLGATVELKIEAPRR